jgi:hypothetical protein
LPRLARILLLQVALRVVARRHDVDPVAAKEAVSRSVGGLDDGITRPEKPAGFLVDHHARDA